ncbi:MAG: VWA domain-containing protein [Acidobacteria bacterium]|nr:VWA domain-containing protein [Acidobacteriota bacterium]
MSFVIVAVALAMATGAPVLASSQSRAADSSWDETVARAMAEAKPIVTFAHFPECPNGSACEAFIKLAGHPASQRRLAGVIFGTRVLDDGEEDASVAVHGPDGTRLIRWTGIPDALEFSKMLSSIEEAVPHIVTSYRASLTGSTPEATRESALALLAFGYELRARPILESMRDSDDAENRQLAAIWLERLDALRAKRLPAEALLEELARDGSSQRVRFEALMATGEVRLATGRIDDAVVSFSQAFELSSDPSRERQLAYDARLRAEQAASPLRGLGGSGAVVTGRRTFWPRSVPSHTARVEYRLDGRLIATSTTAPFAASFGFGRLPRRHELRVTARDKHGASLRVTSVVVNDRVDAFSVRIVEPSSATLSGTVDVVVAVSVPHGLRVDRVVVEWNGERVAKLHAPPYHARVTIKPQEQGVLRAAVGLEDGTELEDVRLINAESMTLESDVHIVEVPVYSGDGSALRRETLTIKENGQSRPVDRVIQPSDAPLLIALVIDASFSMTENMLDVQEAAIRFVEQNIEDEDRVMVIGFDTQVRILWPTRDRSLIQRAILSIEARGYTSLNDAMLTALLQLQAPGWRRAMVVFSDGLDNASKFTAGDVTDVARRSGVPIYVLSLRPAPPVGVPGLAKKSAHWIFAARTELMRIAGSTGGKAWDMTSLARLESIWNEIGDDLQRQYLVAYQPASSEKEWRSIEILDGGKRLRAPSGLAVAPEQPAQ